jgi:tol-pal system protein YbgF
VAKALETMGGTFVTRIEQQDRRLGEMAGALQAVTSQVETLNQAAAQHREAPETGGTKRGTKPHKRVGEAEKEHKPGQRAGQPAAQEPVAQAPPANDPSLQTQPGAPAPGQQVAQAQAASAAPAPDAGEPPAPVPDQVPDSGKPSAKEMYEATLSKFKHGDLEEAQRGFTEFLAQYSTSELAPNAQYWLGECYYGKRDYQRAIEAFDLVRQVYPRSEKAPAALLKQSVAYLEVNERVRATAALKEILNSYPKSPEAGKAGARLAQLEKKR